MCEIVSDFSFCYYSYGSITYHKKANSLSVIAIDCNYHIPSIQ